MTATFAYFKPCVGRSRAEQASRRGSPEPQCGGHAMRPGADIVRVQPQIHFRQFAGQFGHTVTAGQAAAHGQHRPILPTVEIGDHLHHGPDRLFHGRLDKSAGVDEHQIGLLGLRYGRDIGPEGTEQPFRIHPVLRAAETLGINAHHTIPRFG